MPPMRPLARPRLPWFGLGLCLLLSGCTQTDALLRTLNTTQTLDPNTARTGALSTREIAAGLREALRVGTERTVHRLARPNGYYGVARLRIPLPPSLAKLEPPLRQLGFGRQVDDFVLSMNRAGERAAPRAQAIFVAAIRNMRLRDVQRIYQGPNDAATQYFESHTRTQLADAFRPIIAQALNKVGATRAYQRVWLETRTLPFGLGAKTNLDDYVTNRALDGLFLQLAVEEQRIRRDPLARSTALLRQVFTAR